MNGNEFITVADTVAILDYTRKILEGHNDSTVTSVRVEWNGESTKVTVDCKDAICLGYDVDEIMDTLRQRLNEYYNVPKNKLTIWVYHDYDIVRCDGDMQPKLTHGVPRNIQIPDIHPGYVIKRLITDGNYNRETVARELEVTTSYLSLLEDGRKMPSARTISLAAVLFQRTEASFTEVPDIFYKVRDLVKNTSKQNLNIIFDTILKEHNDEISARVKLP